MVSSFGTVSLSSSSVGLRCSTVVVCLSGVVTSTLCSLISGCTPERASDASFSVIGTAVVSAGVTCSGVNPLALMSPVAVAVGEPATVIGFASGIDIIF